MNVDLDLAAHEIALIAAKEHCDYAQSDKADVKAYACDMADSYSKAIPTAREYLERFIKQECD